MKKLDLPPELEPQTQEELLELLDGPAELAPPDLVPDVHQDEPVATYPDWRRADTRVITCAINNDVFPGERYESREEARAAVELKYGRILEANYLPGRAFFRVRRKEVT